MERRRISLIEEPRIPWLDGALAYGAMMPLALALAAAALGAVGTVLAAELARLWAAALLLFFSGVRRGLSFRTEGGATAPQMVAFAALFVAGLGVLTLPVAAALAVAGLGFAAMGIADPTAGLRGEAPLYFVRLRPPQLAIAVASLAGLWLMATR